MDAVLLKLVSSGGQFSYLINFIVVGRHVKGIIPATQLVLTRGLGFLQSTPQFWHEGLQYSIESF